MSLSFNYEYIKSKYLVVNVSQIYIVHWIVLEPLLILLQQSASRLDIDQNLQRNRAVSQREHGFLVKASRECSGCFIHVLRARHITDDDMRLCVIQVDYSGRRQDPAPLHCFAVTKNPVILCGEIMQGLIFRAYRHGRAWRSEIRASIYGNPCLKFRQCLIISATSQPLRVAYKLMWIWNRRWHWPFHYVITLLRC